MSRLKRRFLAWRSDPDTARIRVLIGATITGAMPAVAVLLAGGSVIGAAVLFFVGALMIGTSGWRNTPGASHRAAGRKRTKTGWLRRVLVGVVPAALAIVGRVALGGGPNLVLWIVFAVAAGTVITVFYDRVVP